MTTPRLAVLTTSFPRFLDDEASLFLGRIIDALSDQNVGGVVVVPYDREEEETDVRGNFTVHRKRYGIFRRGALAFGQGILPNLRKNPFLAFQIPALLVQLFRGGLKASHEWEVIHGHWVVTAIPAFLLSCVTNRPFIITVRGEDIKLLRTPLKLFLSPLLKRAASLTTVSDEFKHEITSLLPSLTEKTHTVPNGVERFDVSDEQKSAAKKRLRIADDTKFVLTYVGRVVPLKRPEALIELISLLSERESSCLIIAGRITDRYQQELLALAETLGVSEQVRIPGALSPNEIGTLYHLSSVYLSASSHEGRSNAVLESLAAGVPNFLSDIPGHRELITPDENGILFDPEDLAKAADLLADLLNNVEKWSDLGASARQSVAHLTWESCALEYLKHFSSARDAYIAK